jgi:hypothetical protein
MTCAGTNGTSLAQLQAPRRNRYFYGKLLDVLHLTMEQQYAIAGSAHLNRLNFGPGVLCGLGVTALNRDDGHGVRVESGVAFDALGRRIVVPDAVELLPLQLTDDCGLPVQPQPDKLSGSLVLSICYRECEADFAPALVPDPVCNGSTRCEAGTWVESYSLVVRKPDELPARVTHACRKEVMEKLKAGDVQSALCILAAVCPPVDEDICVPLAVIEVADDGSANVPPEKQCPARPTVPTNLALLDLIACLAQRIEECCGDHAGPDAVATFRVDDLAVGNAADPGIVKLSAPGAMVISTTHEPTTISVAFKGGYVDDNSILLGSNVVVKEAGGAEPAFDHTSIGGGQAERLKLTAGILSPGTYTVTVSGEPPSPVKSTDGEALDASGDGSPGGVFSATFEVNAP